MCHTAVSNISGEVDFTRVTSGTLGTDADAKVQVVLARAGLSSQTHDDEGPPERLQGEWDAPVSWRCLASEVHRPSEAGCASPEVPSKEEVVPVARWQVFQQGRMKVRMLQGCSPPVGTQDYH